MAGGQHATNDRDRRYRVRRGLFRLGTDHGDPMVWGAALNGDRISQENTNPKVLPSASIVAGVNLTRSFGMEIQLDSGFGALSRIYCETRSRLAGAA